MEKTITTSTDLLCRGFPWFPHRVRHHLEIHLHSPIRQQAGCSSSTSSTGACSAPWANVPALAIRQLLAGARSSCNVRFALTYSLRLQSHTHHPQAATGAVGQRSARPRLAKESGMRTSSVSDKSAKLCPMHTGSCCLATPSLCPWIAFLHVPIATRYVLHRVVLHIRLLTQWSDSRGVKTLRRACARLPWGRVGCSVLRGNSADSLPCTAATKTRTRTRTRTMTSNCVVLSSSFASQTTPQRKPSSAYLASMGGTAAGYGPVEGALERARVSHLVCSRSSRCMWGSSWQRLAIRIPTLAEQVGRLWLVAAGGVDREGEVVD